MMPNESHSAAVPPSRGRFIVLDGPDGGGKTTQAAQLADWLRERGLDVVTCRDPGGTALGDRLRSILLDRGSLHPGLRAEMLLYMASRAQLVDERIRPALTAGQWVVSDRYLLSNIVYQGHAGGLGVDEVSRVGRVAIGGVLPDLTLLLDLPTELARDRVGAARDRMEDRPETYHRAVREGFLLAAAEAASPIGCSYYPAPVRLVDASGDAAVVAERIRIEVERALALGPRP
ncbi:MAG: dTMP kinase [Isosphaeraceae bacterium]